MTSRTANRSGLLLLGLLLAATALRLPGLFTDFWLDEIWTLKIVLGMDSAWDVFSEVRHSNNHHLNTLWYWALGDLQTWIPYRLPALTTGIGSVWLAWRIGRRGGIAEATVAAWLFASSYLLVHYSSDARGYAPVVFFGLATFELLAGRRDAGDPHQAIRASWLRCAALGCVAILGFLFHLMYLHVFVAAIAWMATRLWHEGGPRQAVVEGARLFAVPTLFVLLFYWLDIRLTKIGDGPELDATDIFVRALSYALGGPAFGPLALATAAATVLGFGTAVLWWQRERRDAWVLLAVVIFVSPALTFLAAKPEVFFVRYFLLATAFGLLAIAAPLARGLLAGGVLRAVAVSILAAVLAGNALRLVDFYRYGRGDYLSVVQEIAAAATSRLPTVGSDHRFRNSNVIRFYNRYLPVDRRLAHVDQRDRPDWILLHRIGRLGPFAQEISRGDERYELVRVARYSDLSGWHWLAYRRATPR